MLHEPPTVRGGRPHRCTRIDSNRRDFACTSSSDDPKAPDTRKVSLEIEPEGGESEKAS
jgi:hypothetical protein